jgi:hypothetical protein
MDPLLQAESLVAVLGIKHALAKKPRAPSEHEARRAAALPEVIAKRVAALVGSQTQRKQAEPPELPDYRETNEALAKGADEDALVEVMIGVPPELVPAVTLVWTRAIAYLGAIFPRRLEQRLTGPYLHDPSPGEWAEFGWAWRIANAPLFVLDLAQEGMLIGAEVGHLKQMFPAIYAEICARIDDSLADKVAADKEWQPPWWLQKQLCGILGVSPVSPTLVADIEAALQQSQAETKTRTGALNIKNSGETQNQKLAEG